MEANYDKRQRVHWLAYGTTPQLLWGKQYQWSSNSNLQITTDMLSGVQRQFGYDSLSRLTSAQDFVGPTTNLNPTLFGSGSATPTTNSSNVVTAPTAWTDPNDSNMLTNPDSPTGPGWEHNADVTIEYGHLAPDGTTTAYAVTGKAGSTDSYLSASAVPADLYDGETMTGSIWLRSPSGPKTIDLFLEELGPTLNGRAAKTVTATQQWQQFQLSGVYQYGYQYVLFQVGGVNTLQAGQTIEAWGAKLEDTGTAGRTVTNFARYSQQIVSSWGGTSNVSVTNSSAIAPDGTRSAATVIAQGSIANNDESWIVNMVHNHAPFSGMKITGSVWLRSPNGTQTISLCLISDNAINSSSVNVTLTTAWQRFQVTSSGMSTSGMLQLQIGGGHTFTPGQTIQVWGAQVELAQSAGPYVATGLDPVSIGTNLTNILSYSQDPTAPSWTYTTSVTTAPNSVIAPDGSKTAAEMTATSNDSYAVNDALNPALYNSQLVTGSVFLRTPSGSRNVSVCVFGDTSSSRASQCTTASLTTTWKRFNVSVQLPNALARVAMQIGGGNSFASGQVIDVWGTQIELNSRAGTYVHTGSLPIIKGQEPENLLSSSQLDDGQGWSYP
ncbi:MAG: hypothetical protein JF563_00275, partial [Acidobacteriales bacterium]|nr:hypothetical protein [Terriglobales bacterium]